MPKAKEGDEEQEEQEQQSAAVVARRGAQERGAALCAPRWRNFLAGDILRVGVPGRGGFLYLSIYLSSDAKRGKELARVCVGGYAGTRSQTEGFAHAPSSPIMHQLSQAS